MELLVMWVVLSAIVGLAASAKGRSGVGFFLLSLLITPLIGLLVALVVPRVDATPVRVINQPGADPTSQIASLASLRDSGAISDDEYQVKKAELLARV